MERRTKNKIPLIESDNSLPWNSRGLNEETCKRWGIGIGEYKGQACRVFNYFSPDGNKIAQKLRISKDNQKFIGEPKEAGLFGQHLCRDSGKKIVITEGEIDAATVSQVQDHKWPTVSVKNGSSGAKRDIQKALDWLQGFEEVILMFDMDEPGQSAAKECALLFKPGHCKIAHLPLNDPNDMLMARRGSEIINCIWNAKVHRPDGIITLKDVKERAKTPVEPGLPWCLDSLTDLTYGRREGELYGFGAGTGIGKTDLFVQQVAYDMTELHKDVAVFFFEMDGEQAVRRIAGKYAGKPFHEPDGDYTQEDVDEAIDELDVNSQLFIYDNFGSCDWDVVAKRIRYLAHAEGVKLFYIDHLTALSAAVDDPVRFLEKMMAELAAMTKELGIIVHYISHLATPEGRPHEEGGRVMSRHFKGSRAIQFWSHYMFGLERNPQADDKEEAQTTTLRVLKARYSGKATGDVLKLGYDTQTTKLFEKDIFDDGPERSEQTSSAERVPASFW
jgi:twinkle protein